jgi:transposase-like protein
VPVKPFELYENISEFIETFEENKKKKKVVKKDKGVEKFLE